MGLFRKRTEQDTIDPSWVRATAIVVSADAPPQGAPSHGPFSRCDIQVVAESPTTGRRKLSGTFRHADTRWVVPGMDVPIAIDPAQPATFVVDWSAVPAMEQMVAANHPALADPFAASRRVAAAAGITPSEKTAARLERFQQAVTAAGAQPAPPGRIRAVAMTVSVRGRYDSGAVTDGSSSAPSVSLTSNSAAVLSVAVPGRPPYAVYVPRFKFQARRLSIPGEPIPILVSANDPQAVEILWGETPSMDEQIASRMADSARSNNQLMTAMSEQYQAAIAQAIANPPQIPPGTHPAVPTQPGAGMPPQMRQLMIDNLKRALLYMPNPAQRQMIIDQYRAMGLDVTAEEIGL